MNWWVKKPRRSARVLIIEDGRLLTFLRKRHSQKTGEWIEYYSIPGGGIDRGETPEQAAKRELREEMGVEVGLAALVAHRTSAKFEHFIYHGHIRKGIPHLMQDSEEAHFMNEHNQFIVEWVDIATLTKEKLRYYSDYYELICRLADGEKPTEVLQITAP